MNYVCLDIGNVLCHVDFNTFAQAVSVTLNVAIEDVFSLIKKSQKMHDLGLTTMQDQLRDTFKVKSPIIINKLLEFWNTCVSANLSVLNMFNNLHQQHDLKIALLSNIGPEHAHLMETILDHNDFFKNSIKHFSFQVGARKPSNLFYQSFLLEYPEFQGCLYIDDLVENLDIGKIFGFRSYHFALDTMDILQELTEIKRLLT